MLKPLTDITGVPLQGGCITKHHKALLPFGSFSDMKNMRGEHPGLRKRPGQAALHTVPDSVALPNDITAISKADPGVVSSTAHALSVGDIVYFAGLTQMTELNGTSQVVTVIDTANTFSVNDTSGYTSAESTGGATGFKTNEGYSAYQFKKQRISETHLFAQMSDGDVLDATAAPPTVTTGAFGSEVFDGGASQVPASWGSLSDMMIHSNGVDQHQTYTGDDNYVTGFIVFDGVSAAPANIPEHGEDYTVQVTDGLTTTAAILDSLDTYANYECVFICTPVAATKLTWTISKPNATTSRVATLWYRRIDNTWADTGMTDTTKGATTATLSTTGGTMEWTKPAVDGTNDEIPMFMYGQTGFWYQLRISTGTLDGEVEVTKVTFGSGFQDLVNVWDGVIPYAVEAIFYDQSASTYSTHATGSIILDDMTHSADDTVDRLYFNSADPIQGIYIDVGSQPNTTTNTTIKGVYAWDGDSFTTVGTVTDGTSGLNNSGWITWARPSTVHPTQFQTTQYYAYWYYIAFATATMSADVVIAMYTMPYFNIEDLGHGRANCVWKDRAAYSFTNYGNYVYITASGTVTGLNGTDYGILKAGDGRTNNIAAMRNLYNEMLVLQEEKGLEGGSITLFQGYSPTTFGKLVLNSNVGTMSNKTVAVVPGVLTSTATEEKIKTLCFFLSRYGVGATDGTTISIVSDDIQNYFDPTKTECIRKGYEDKMWLKYDSAFNVVRIGLVSGGSATLPNVFPVLDLNDHSWSFDTPAQELSFITEAEAGSGDITVLQVGMGTNDGLLYLLNSGTNDVSTAIDSFAIMELNSNGKYIQFDEMMIRAEAVASSAGDITLTFTKNTISAGSKTLSMSPEVTNQTIIRHRFNLNITDQNISIKMQNNAASKAMTLLDVGVRTQIYEDR